MNEIYSLIEYDLLDIRLNANITQLLLSFIWGEYDESRVELVIDDLLYFNVKQCSSRKGEFISRLPFFVEKLVVNEVATAENLTFVELCKNALGPEEKTRKLYYINVGCVRTEIEAVALIVSINDSNGLVSYGNIC